MLRVALLGPSARVGGCAHSVGHYNLGVLEGACHPPHRGLREVSSPPQGYGGPQAYQVAEPFHVIEAGPCNGELNQHPFLLNTDMHLYSYMCIYFYDPFAIFM